MLTIWSQIHNSDNETSRKSDGVGWNFSERHSWSLFLEQGKTINGDRYLSMLKDKLRPHMDIHGCTIFMHDGAPCHRAKKVTEFIKSPSFTILEWPGNSPDLNPIENMWMFMKDKVALHQPSSLAELIEIIKKVWVKEISPGYCETLIRSMPRRLAAVIASGGGSTKYYVFGNCYVWRANFFWIIFVRLILQ